MTLFALYIVSFIVLIFGILLFVLTASKPTKTKKLIAATATLTACLSLIGSTCLYAVGVSHGASTVKMPITAMITGISKSHTKDTLPDDTKGSIIILYKFGCPDCEAVYEDLSEMLKDRDVYWIASTDDDYKNLVETFNIEEVPTGLYMRQNDLNSSVQATKYILYITDRNGNSIIDTESVERLMYLQDEGR